MDVQAFERLLGPCMDIMKRNIANYEEQLVTLFGSNTEIADQNAWESERKWTKTEKQKVVGWVKAFAIVWVPGVL